MRWGASPMSRISSMEPDLFNSRSTSRSPKEVGMVETRTSMSWSPTRTSNRPSWGKRFSAMFILDMTLTRESRAGWIHLGGVSRS